MIYDRGHIPLFGICLNFEPADISYPVSHTGRSKDFEFSWGQNQINHNANIEASVSIIQAIFWPLSGIFSRQNKTNTIDNRVNIKPM